MSYFLKNYIDTVKSFSFKGRATRKQYWLFTLFQFFIFIAFFSIILFLQQVEQTSGTTIRIVDTITALYSIYLVATAIQSLAITTRRLHDANFSGWWQLIMFIPYLGNVILLVLILLPSKNQNNRFGTLPEQY